MKQFNVQSNDKEVVIRFDKSEINTEAMLKILKRLQVEYLAQKADFKDNLLDIATEIDNQWWEANNQNFLKNVKK